MRSSQSRFWESACSAVAASWASAAPATPPNAARFAGVFRRSARMVCSCFDDGAFAAARRWATSSASASCACRS